MRQFNYSDLANQTWDHEFLAYIAKIHEYKGKQELLLHQKPVILDRLLKITEIRAIDRISTSHIYKTPVIRGF